MNNNNLTKRYYQLLEKKKQLINAGMSAREIYAIPEMKELTEYAIAIEDEKFYQNRNLYFDCIEKFLTNIIDGEEMIATFMGLRNEDIIRELTLVTDENLKQKPEKISFSELIDELEAVCEEFDIEATTYDEHNETWLYETVLMEFSEWRERNPQFL